jgi:hypothetical protein
MPLNETEFCDEKSKNSKIIGFKNSLLKISVIEKNFRLEIFVQKKMAEKRQLIVEIKKSQLA